MPLPVIADVIRVGADFVCPNGHKAANILHFRKTGALSFPAAIALLDPKVLGLYTTALGGGIPWTQNVPSPGALQPFTYTPLDGSSATTVISHSNAGGSAAEALPASTALVVTLRTATRGRSFRGRVYWGPWNEAANGPGGVPTAANVTGAAAQWAGFVTSLVGTGLSLVVASYKLATATDVATTTVDSRWDTQRRRLNT
jgi:hypothetical protein